MPIQRESQIDRQEQKSTISSRLNSAGIRVRSGKKAPKKGEYSGVVGKSNKVLKIKI